MNNKGHTLRQLLPSLTGGVRGWVSITRMKGYTALSLLGLVISLSGTVIISRYLHQEWTVDHFMPDLDRTYILGIHFNAKSLYDENDYLVSSYDPNHEASFISPVEGQSEIEAYCDIELRKDFPITQEGREVIYPAAITVQDTMFFQVYPLDIVKGARRMTADGQCIISEELAHQLFPGEDAVGKSINIEDGTPHTIQAVFSQPATKSTLRFDLIQFRKNQVLSNSQSLCLVLLHEGASVETYNERQPFQQMTLHANQEVKYCLRPYHDVPIRQWNQRERDGYKCVQPTSSPAHLWMLLFVAALLLFVGLFNFVNLYAVMRSQRRHELEVRRIFGASRWNIFCQLYAETFVLAVLTMIGVWTVVELTAPLLVTYYHIDVMPQWTFDVGLTVTILLGLPLITSRPTPNPSREGGGWLRGVCLIPAGGRPSLTGGVGGGSAGAFLFLQFFISLTLLNVSLYFMRQLNVMMSADPGFRTRGLLNATIYPPPSRGSWTMEEFEAMIAQKNSQTQVVKQKLDACPYLKGVTLDGGFINGNMPFDLADGNKVDIMYITGDAVRMFGLQLIEGILPSDSLSMDDYVCVANESAIKALGIKNRETDFVQFADRLWWSSDKDCSSNPPYRIIGVVKDFNPGRQSEPIRPLLLMIENWTKEYDIFDAHQMEGRNYLLDIAEGHEEDIIRDLKDLQKELFGTNDLKYQWVEDQRKALYSEDQRTARIFVTFSLLAIAVTCLGVLGLMLFEIRRRYREIALRKVHGATFRDIALLLSRRYLIVFTMAAVASLPVSLLVIHRLMATYTVRTSFAWWIPLASIALILALCALTLWQQVWKATRIRAYEVLKEN